MPSKNHHDNHYTIQQSTAIASLCPLQTVVRAMLLCPSELVFFYHILALLNYIL